jgi:hypothetical protein
MGRGRWVCCVLSQVRRVLVIWVAERRTTIQREHGGCSLKITQE